MGENKQRKDTGSRFHIHRRALGWMQKIYYRYSVETGICVLEWWESVLVNIYFLLLLSSLIKQIVRIGIYLADTLMKWHFLGRP
ncbi:DUF3317 domain-containing protein [Encephalitozoon intestinalis ATCC 50506]|uniref:DUF3317 domain-containing protein n=1 Tax=Encephalitozoon intestinalis (strain ATCC 50506) TaxID=876142 RepID=W8P8W5_ENCIT|nr:DUF3317 domain-containing protein [Encephalitozoon intestinalis ATCC 50506]AHL30078.1 DUF3317 domain-containing protein [Encephalitozoon intestinalis ATCC 50506]UTX44715.1 hypothetical protein GPK93_02g02320 [Encephalitozoon intestinalis]